MSRGNRRQAMFLDDVDRHDFLRTRAEACPKTAWQVHAFCLLSNHYHLEMRIAVRLRRETTLSIKDIVMRVHLGTSNRANARLYRAMKTLGLADSSQKSVRI